MIITRTPFRVSFFGGGTDYPAWYRKEGGAVISTTIDKYCYITCRRLPPFFPERHRIVWSKIELTSDFATIAHPAIRGALQHLAFADTEGIEIHHQGDLPARSGMGSSSAFVVGILKALSALQGKMLSKEELARQSVHFEQNVLQEHVGSQDQVAAAYGGLNLVTFGRDDSLTVEPIILPPARKQALNDRLFLYYTGTDRIASNIAKDLVSKLDRECDRLRRMRAMVDEGLRILNSPGSLDAFGELLHQSWLEKRQLSNLISNDEIDELYGFARQSGALGGKLLGAGRAGFMLFYVPPEKAGAFQTAMKKCLHVPFRFENAGSTIVHHTNDG